MSLFFIFFTGYLRADKPREFEGRALISRQAANLSSNTSQKIYLGNPIKICDISLILQYECSDDNLEDAINAFKSNALIGYCDIRSLLVSYAQKKGMTDKQAVCHIVTKIDVPEIEGNALFHV